MVAGAAMALIHAFLTITIRVNQIVSGLALTIFAGIIGLSSYLGEVWNIGGVAGPPPVQPDQPAGPEKPADRRPSHLQPGRLRLRVVGTGHRRALLPVPDPPGPVPAGRGGEPGRGRRHGDQCHRLPLRPYPHRGALAGLGGAYFTLALAPIWTDGLTAGVGWIAIALVIFAFWRPDLLVLGAYLFGVFSALGPTLQTHHITALPSEFYSALPFLMTVIALAAASTSWANRRIGTPASLGVPYTREQA